jgi:hypothetical protein
VRQHHQQIAGGVWAAQVVGGRGCDRVWWFCRQVWGWGQRGSAVSLPCVVGRLLCQVGHRRHLHGVGLAGAWVWGAVATFPVWSGPGWCSGHWCGLAVPKNIEVTAALGDVACLGPWGQLGSLLCPRTRTSGRGCHGLVCCVSCVMVPGAGCGGLLLWAGVLCDMAAGVGQCKHGGGA